MESNVSITESNSASLITELFVKSAACNFKNCTFTYFESVVSAATSITKENSSKYVKAVGNLAASTNNLTKKITMRLLRILDQVAQKVNVSDGEVFNATTPNIFVAVVNLPEANSSDKDHGFGVGLRAAFQPNTGKFFSNYSFSLYFEDKIINQTSIFVPYQIIDKSKDGKVSFYSFLGDSLFNANSSMNKIKDKHGFEKSIVNSYVILSATILDPENTTENFTEKIQISFEMNESLQMPSVFGSSSLVLWILG
ncbi:uncharacterized protein LOC143459764 isoform X2 [Clavelina lepadiformis]|uniref:uncharacterized protein LOC143459764 isoform X2 n=1 Tax=Clavelina lepadiformis TaxID=159417 RepID=UPI004041F76F